MPLDTPERASFDYHDEIDLSKIEPMIALPSSPDNVVPVREVAGTPIHQAYIGSSANPAWRDFAISARMLKGKNVASHVSFDINPSTRRVLTNLIATGDLNTLLIAGGRLHQTGCNGCNGMGQAPASGKNSLRTVPRNFPGRSGTLDDSVYLCSQRQQQHLQSTGELLTRATLALQSCEFLNRRIGLWGRALLFPHQK